MKYKNWYDKQSDKFKKEINPGNIETTRFIDWSSKPIDLETLKKYDKEYCEDEETKPCTPET